MSELTNTNTNTNTNNDTDTDTDSTPTPKAPHRIFPVELWFAINAAITDWRTFNHFRQVCRAFHEEYSDDQDAIAIRFPMTRSEIENTLRISNPLFVPSDIERQRPKGGFSVLYGFHEAISRRIVKFERGGSKKPARINSLQDLGFMRMVKLRNQFSQLMRAISIPPNPYILAALSGCTAAEIDLAQCPATILSMAETLLSNTYVDEVRIALHAQLERRVRWHLEQPVHLHEHNPPPPEITFMNQVFRVLQSWPNVRCAPHSILMDQEAVFTAMLSEQICAVIRECIKFYRGLWALQDREGRPNEKLPREDTVSLCFAHWVLGLVRRVVKLPVLGAGEKLFMREWETRTDVLPTVLQCIRSATVSYVFLEKKRIEGPHAWAR